MKITRVLQWFTLMAVFGCQTHEGRSLSVESGHLDDSQRGQTSAFLPAEVGDHWLYDDPALPDATITEADGGWRHYSDFGNLGPRWIYSRVDSPDVYTWSNEHGVVLLFELDANIGATYDYPQGLLPSIEEAVVESRDQALETPAGAFAQTYGIRFGNEHLIVLAKNVGVIAARGTCHCGGFNPDPEHHPWPQEHCCLSGLLAQAQVAGWDYPLQNLAWQAQVSAEEPSWNHPRANLVDGDPNTAWFSRTALVGQPEWIELAWDAPQSLTDLQLYWNPGWQAGSVRVWIRQDGAWLDRGSLTIDEAETTRFELLAWTDGVRIALQDPVASRYGINEIQID